MSKLAMDAQTWATLSDLLDTALELPDAAREQWIEALPVERDNLKPQLRALLANAAVVQTDGFLDTLPEVQLDAAVAGELGFGTNAAGDCIGPYRLVRELGVGGMGAVWLAERSDGVLKRSVALKLPHGAWRQAGLAERMAREREILASLNHPNIARLYDAGIAEDGQPYLAIEYVAGRPIDVYCREQSLDIVQRIHLFTQAAQAVAYAHGSLVIHRDLKPANILVTPAGEVKLLDFGIAKLLDAGQAQQTHLTQLSGRALTPDYASPEHIRGGTLTVASDVYSLGVLLYRLLTGARPYKLKRESRGALEDAILHADPLRPSDAAGRSHHKALRGDLDTIVLQALKKRPEERYATVHALLDDIERHLDHRPVQARPDGSWYRISKFAARHKFGVAATATVLAALVAGAGVAMWQSHVAVQQKRRAEAVKDFLVSIFRDADPYAAIGKPPSVADLLRHARERIDQAFLGQPPLRAELLAIVGASSTAIEDFATAQAALDAAVEQASAVFGGNDPRTLHARVLRLAVLRYRGQTDVMGAELKALLPLLRQQPAGEDLLLAIENQAHQAIDEGRYVDAEQHAGEAFATARRVLGDDDAYTTALSRLLVVTYTFNKKYGIAYPAAKQAFERTLVVARNNTLHPSVIDARASYGKALANVGRLAEGIEQVKQATLDAETLLGPSSAMVGFFSGHLAWLLLDDGNLGEAVRYADKHRSILTKTAAPGSFTYASTLFNHGAIVLAAKQTTLALEELQQAQRMLADTLGPTHDMSRRAKVEYALALAYAGNFSAAQRQLDERFKQAAPADNAGMDRALHVAGVLDRLRGDHQAAATSLQAALQAIRPGVNAERMRMRILTETGLNHLGQAEDERAAQAFEAALALADRLERHVSCTRADALAGLGRIRMRQGRRAEALALLGAADQFWRSFDPGHRSARNTAHWLSMASRHSAVQ